MGGQKHDFRVILEASGAHLEARGPILEARRPMWRISEIVVILKTFPVRKSIPFRAPCWAQVGAKFELSWVIFIKKVFQNTLGKHLAFEHRFLTKMGLPGPPRTPENLNFVWEGYKFSPFRLFACWMALGCQLGPILGPFWVPSWAMLGTKLA